jgi:hypothetical protein
MPPSMLLTQSRHQALASGCKAHNMMLKDFCRVESNAILFYFALQIPWVGALFG